MKPIIHISRCLGFEAVRYNGEIIPDNFIEELKLFVEFKTVCPEMEIGMGVPRPPIHIQKSKDGDHLIQPSTGKDFTTKMTNFAKKRVAALKEVDGFILKAKSPSCGLGDTKFYSEKPNTPALGKRNGLYAEEVKKQFPHAAIASEMQLTNMGIRESFLTQIFLMADFRAIKKHLKMKDLVRFHSENKYLMLAYHEKIMRRLGLIVANNEKLKVEKVFEEYEVLLPQIFEKPCKPGAVINVLMHGFGFVSDKLTRSEKTYFLKLLEQYRSKKIPLSTCTAVLKVHAERFKEEYLLSQRFFSPYPEELKNIKDTGH